MLSILNILFPIQINIRHIRARVKNNKLIFDEYTVPINIIDTKSSTTAKDSKNIFIEGLKYLLNKK